MSVALGHGRTVEIARGNDDILEIRTGAGELELAIVLTAEGPKLRLRAADLELVAARNIRIKCQSFELEAQESARLVSPRGQITLAANDDIDLRGERILLNADAQPMPTDWDEALGAAATKRSD